MLVKTAIEWKVTVLSRRVALMIEMVSRIESVFMKRWELLGVGVRGWPFKRISLLISDFQGFNALTQVVL